jgi:hypothetical protein
MRRRILLTLESDVVSTTAAVDLACAVGRVVAGTLAVVADHKF